MRELARQAKLSLRFANYKPADLSLGEKAPSSIVLPEKLEKETQLRLEKLARACFADSRHPTKIIPKKATLDLETKLQPTVDRLKLLTDLAIVQLLKDKLDAQRGKPAPSEEPSTVSEQAVPPEPQPQLRRPFEPEPFAEVAWVDELDGELPAKFAGDIMGGIEMMEKVYGLGSDHESVEDL